MILSGIGVASYPVISNAVAQRHASEAIQNYDDTVKSMDTEKLDAAKEAATPSSPLTNNWHLKAICSCGAVHRPWSWTFHRPLPQQKNRTLKSAAPCQPAAKSCWHNPITTAAPGF